MNIDRRKQHEEIQFVKNDKGEYSLISKIVDNNADEGYLPLLWKVLKNAYNNDPFDFEIERHCKCSCFLINCKKEQCRCYNIMKEFYDIIQPMLTIANVDINDNAMNIARLFEIIMGCGVAEELRFSTLRDRN